MYRRNDDFMMCIYYRAENEVVTYQEYEKDCLGKDEGL